MYSSRWHFAQCFGLVGLLAVAGSCASKSDPAGAAAGPPTPAGSESPLNTAPVVDLGEGQKSAVQARVSCVDPAQCDPSVGMLISTTNSMIAACTATLIGPDLLATNSHCIPEDLKAGGGACTGRIWVSFPASGSLAAAQLECAQVLAASDISAEQATPPQTVPDFAFIRLRNKSGRPARVPSHDGFNDLGIYSIVKMNPSFDGSIPAGTIERVDCQAVFGSALVPNSDRVGAPLVTLVDCPVIRGNSGAPILDSEGRVRGLVQGFEDVRYAPEALRAQAYEAATPNLNVGTSYACVALPDVPSANLSRDCTDDAQAAVRSAAHAQASLQAQFVAASGSLALDPAWQPWTLTVLPGTVALTGLGPLPSGEAWSVPTPRCFDGDALWRKPEAKILPVFRVKSGLNRYFQTDFSLQLETSSHPFRFTADAPGLPKGKRTLSVLDASSTPKFLIKTPFAACPPPS